MRFNWSVLAILLLLLKTGVSQRDTGDEKEGEEEEEEENYGMEQEEEEGELNLKGHMEPIGNSGWSWEVEETSELLDPITFYDNYVTRSKPLIFRGLARKYPSFDMLHDDQHIKKNYGKWKVSWELRKKEDRKGADKRGSYKTFLDSYKKKPIYLVSDIMSPNPLTKEVYIPKMILCEGLRDQIETVILWQSSGGTKSVLHADTVENLNCVIDGTKDFIMIHKSQFDQVPQNDAGTSSPVDVEKVDIYKYPQFSKTSWYKAHIRAGDCLYIPEKWLHHVESRGGSNNRSLAFNVWFSQTAEFPSRDQCQSKLHELADFEPWSNFIKKPDLIKRNTVVTYFGKEKEPFSVDRFHDVVHSVVGAELEQTQKLFKQIDVNDDGLVSLRDMYDSNIEFWLPLFVDQDDLMTVQPAKYQEVSDAKDEL